MPRKTFSGSAPAGISPTAQVSVLSKALIDTYSSSLRQMVSTICSSACQSNEGNLLNTNYYGIYLTISTSLIRYVNALILISTLAMHERIYLNSHCGYTVCNTLYTGVRSPKGWHFQPSLLSNRPPFSL